MIRILLVAIFLLLSVQASSQNTNANWLSLDRSQLPARVTTIRASQEYSMNLTDALCWGKWCVNFPKSSTGKGKDYPIAVAANRSHGFQNYQHSGGRVLKIEFYVTPLSCRNEVLGDSVCYLYLAYEGQDTKISRYYCAIVVGITPAETIDPIAEFDIRCPDIYLQ